MYFESRDRDQIYSQTHNLCVVRVGVCVCDCVRLFECACVSRMVEAMTYGLGIGGFGIEWTVG